jgi:hypothetical protein
MNYSTIQHTLTLLIEVLVILPLVVMAVDFLFFLDRLDTADLPDREIAELPDTDLPDLDLPDLDLLTRSELVLAAKTLGIKVSSKATKAQIRGLLLG